MGIKVFLHRVKRMLQEPQQFIEHKLYPGMIDKFIVPVVLKEKKENILFTDFAFDNFHILTHETFYKIAGFGGTMEVEFENWKKLKELAPMKKYIPEAAMMSKLGFQILSTKKLEPLKDEKEAERAGDDILTAFRSLGYQKLIDKKSLHNIDAGLEQIENNYGPELSKSYALRLEYIFRKPLIVGPVHGDFHQGNILKDTDGTPQLIDWDCYEPSGIQALDAISLMLYTDCKKNNTSWLRQLREYDRYHWKTICFPAIFEKFVDLNTSDIGLVFFLNQLGIDARYHKMTEAKLKEVSVMVESLPA